MANRRLRGLSVGKKVLFAVAGLMAVGMPVVAGVMASPRQVTPLKGQTDDEFEAVAIKRVKNGFPPIPRLEVDPGYLRAAGASLHYLITQAFGIEDYQMSRTADWMESESYAINAASGRAVDRVQMMTMLRHMLATRFHLTVHHETREVPVFALVVDKRGSKLAPLGQGDDPVFFQSSGDRLTLSIGSSIQDLVRHLNSRTGSAALGRPVVDRTGLQGLYRIRLTFGVELDSDGKGGRLDIDLPSALISQLGLRLEPTKAAIDILAIDSAERPKPEE
jgi:uncharacterized protein (TIGR03435 family)